ncbi:MAG TPA: hypothetical protein VIX37_01210, partial [Candidatus Sulfotelmatobacter sp.]
VAVSSPASAQEVPALTISPGRVTMLQGETRTFRAVGKDGRMRHNVRWSVSLEHAAKLTTNGDEAVVQAEAEATGVTLTASAQADSAQATVDIGSNHALPAGTLPWTVAPLPGCKSKKMTQAVPSATGPDLYDEEECPQGAFVRALTADGRELWRRQITPTGAVVASEPVTQPPADTGQPLDPHRASVCDAGSSGMTKDEVSKVVSGHDLNVEKKQWGSDNWEFEEEGSRCMILFDANTATVVKKKKTVVTD